MKKKRAIPPRLALLIFTMFAIAVFWFPEIRVGWMDQRTAALLVSIHLCALLIGEIVAEMQQ